MGSLLPLHHSPDAPLLPPSQSKVSAAINCCLPSGSIRRFVVTDCGPKVGLGVAIAIIVFIGASFAGHKFFELINLEGGHLKDHHHFSATVEDVAVGIPVLLLPLFTSGFVALCAYESYTSWKRKQT